MKCETGHMHAGSRRREFILAVIAWPVLALTETVFAQSKQQILIGWLNTDSRELSGQNLTAFKDGLAGLGWKEGVQYVIEERWANARVDQLHHLAEDLVAKKPAIIVGAAAAAAIAAAKAAPTVPIVFAITGDPVALGLVKTFARPGGVITGVTDLSTTVTEKYLELLLATVPKLKGVGILIDSNAVARTSFKEAALRSVAQYQVEARFAEVANPDEIESALSRLAKEGVQALIVTGGLMLRNERRRIVKLALAHRWPVVVGSGGWAEAGALLTYSADTLANYRRVAYYVDRILKGAKPSDLPIEQPTKFGLVVNMNTAKALNLKIPNSILLRADRVIE